MPETIDPEKEFPKLQKMIHCLAWRKSLANGLDFEELKADAKIGFMLACQKYEPGRGAAFASFVFSRVDYHLREVVEKEYRRRQLFSMAWIDDSTVYSHARTPFLDVLSTVSPLAQKLLRMILENDVNRDGEKMTPIQLLGRSMDRLVELGYIRFRVESARIEIRNRLREVWSETNPDHVGIEGMTPASGSIIADESNYRPVETF